MRMFFLQDVLLCGRIFHSRFIHSRVIHTRHAHSGPEGVLVVAELPLVPFAPAVAAAIHDACGVWVSDLPFTPERVLAALRRAEPSTPATP